MHACEGERGDEETKGHDEGERGAYKGEHGDDLNLFKALIILYRRFGFKFF